MNHVENKRALTSSNIVKIALLSAISFILTLPGFRWDLPTLFPHFLSMDFSDLPAILGLVLMGPVPAVWIAALKNVLDVAITGTASAGIGPFANFLVATAYILSMGYVIARIKGFKGIIIGAIIATIITTIMASILNYTILVRAYAFVFGVDIEVFVEVARVINPAITSFERLIALSIAPFNLFKFGLVSIAFIILYKAMELRTNLINKRG